MRSLSVGDTIQQPGWTSPGMGSREIQHKEQRRHHQLCQGDLGQSLGLPSQCSLPPQHVPGTCSLPQWICYARISSSYCQRAFWNALSSIQHRLFPPFPGVCFLLNYHTFLSPLVASHLSIFRTAVGGVRQSLSTPWQSWWKQGIGGFCNHWKVCNQLRHHLWQLRYKATGCERGGWKQLGRVQHLRNELCRKMKLEWNFPPGYESAANRDSCGWEGIFPKGSWQKLRLWKEEAGIGGKIIIKTAHFYGNILL